MLTISPARAAALAVAGALACTSPARGPADSSAPGARPATTGKAAPPATAGDTGCVLRGQWRLCSVQDRLERAGLAPRLDPDTLRQPFLRVPGRRLQVGTAELQLFVYTDAAAAARDVAPLDTVRVAPAAMLVEWIAPPTLITSNNLVAILLSRNPRQIERVRNALTAGLPPE